ncbi:excinuclease ABC subunit UvrA [Spiroplasma endosymbiont of Amphibalanus improvisus]|uniref:excinuclease ABC subunit UvrA n=1 Tax=Spiroplasma endosymbiont of Amphibalanus improvisus TaxID=3066327 RepID=UPI00313F0BC9
MNDNNNWITIKGARENNLKNIDLKIPKNKMIAFTGLSGSGKSSLAFGTIYSEGRRRYIESLSSYARQFLGGNEKPDVDQINGLSPAISIDQKTTSKNPRSTVGTITEIYDYLRLLYARAGTPYCINGHGPVKTSSIKTIIEEIKKIISDNNEKLIILAPVVIDKKGSHLEVFDNLKKEGFIRVKVDGIIKTLDDQFNLEKNERHNIDIIVDRLIYDDNDEFTSRLHDAIEVCLKYSKGLVKIHLNKIDKSFLFSSNYSCKECGFNVPNLEPRLFSFNAPIGACYECKGLGIRLEVDEDLLIEDKSLSISDGAIRYFKNFINTQNIEWQKFKALLDHYKISIYVPYEDFSNEQKDIILNGTSTPIQMNIITTTGRKYEPFEPIEGIAKLIERRYIETTSNQARDYYHTYMSDKKCNVCKGQKLNPIALSVKIDKLSIYDFTNLSIEKELEKIINVQFTEQQQQIVKLVLDEIINRLDFLNQVGLGYLSLSRTASTLSGGEAQRIRLATQIGSQLSGVLYVLDEPSIGLHQVDNDKLIKTLKNLRDLGNTLIVVEHDEETIRNSDWVVDIGPEAGDKGGNVIASSTYEEFLKHKDSITAKYLRGEEKILTPKSHHSGNGLVLEIKEAAENNLNKIDVKFPLNKFICLTGVSGSGKSTLMNEILHKGIKKYLKQSNKTPGKHKEIKGIDNIEKVVNISQSPIGKTPRSNPATYTSVFDDIRDLFTNTPEAKMRGYLKGRFSFNVHGGRCENCQGDGIIKISMQFMPTVYVTCEICEGRRYNEETLLVKYKNQNIYNILEMTVDKALEFFENIPKIVQKLQTMQDVGLGYIKLGQPAPQLSGGEAQRVKLSTFLLKKTTKKTLFLLDEPTTGLHVHDVKQLLKVFERIVKNGGTVVCIEHNLDVIKCSDYIIDLGPGGGINGGNVLATGTPEQLLKSETSITARYLEKLLK